MLPGTYYNPSYFLQGDVIGFYLTPVVTTTPLDDMKTMKLPPNLHVQHDYVRFHPGILLIMLLFFVL